MKLPICPAAVGLLIVAALVGPNAAHSESWTELKLLADGIRDAVLIPVAMVATLIGLLRGGDHPDREFKRVIDLGMDSERWINLFNHHEPLDSAGSMDDILDRVETVVREQVQKGEATDGDNEAIDRAFKDAHKEAHRDVDI